MLNVRKDFPILKQKVKGKQLVYLDSAATSQKPKCVIEAIRKYYYTANANAHKSLHTLSALATDMYEQARKKVADFIGANPSEIIFVRNTTEGINLVAHSLAESNKIKFIVSTVMEHHSNMVPWQQVAKKNHARLEYITINDDGTLDMKRAKELIMQKPSLVAFTHISNVLGTINPVKELAELSHKYGALVLVDGAQAVSHIPINVKELDVDFYVFSGHKMFGPMGIGVVYGKKELLENMEPFLTGGNMIKEVSLAEATWNDLPNKFEAGTSNVADTIGLGAAIDYLDSIGMNIISKHEEEILEYALKKMKKIKGITIYGPEKKSGVISFNLGDIHPHDLASILDEEGIAIRSGHLCAQPLMKILGVNAVARISVSIYTTKKEIDKLILGLEKARRIFRL